MKIEQFLCSTIVKTGREARELIDNRRIFIAYRTCINCKSYNCVVAQLGRQVYSYDIVFLQKKLGKYRLINHPSSNG
jgi:hypothetical protein